jgi:hypothetical protein
MDLTDKTANAIARAKQLVEGRDLELWDRDKMIARFSGGPF